MNRTLCALAIALTCVWAAAGSGESTAVAAPGVDICETANCAQLVIGVSPGNGSGRVTSEPGGIDCGISPAGQTGTCDAQFVWPLTQPFFAVTLTYRPATGSVGQDVTDGRLFGLQSEVVMLQPGSKTVLLRYRFILSKHEVTASTSGVGSGRVVINGGRECRAPCSVMVEYGTQLTFEALPDVGAAFKTWTGACNGKGPTCSLTITQATATNAVFALADTSVAAQVVSVRATTGKRARRVRAELRLEEDVSVALELRRSGKRLASKIYLRVQKGRRALSLLVPSRVETGRAVLRITLADGAGNERVVTRTVFIPERAR